MKPIPWHDIHAGLDLMARELAEAVALEPLKHASSIWGLTYKTPLYRAMYSRRLPPHMHLPLPRIYSHLHYPHGQP